MTLAAQGVTVMVSSGDNGAPNVLGSVCLCNFTSGSSILSWDVPYPWTGQGYFPSFPATSPYVTAVGATQGPQSGGTEIACQSQLGGVITTGGGFSSYFNTTPWQADAVNYYFEHLGSTQNPIKGYNRNGRAYPDISLIGVDYQVVVGGYIQNVFGTSCTSPVIAAFVSLVNAQRQYLGLSSIGFLNPTLYSVGYNNTIGISNSYDAKFNDITSGNNKCCANGNPSSAKCCKSGFSATKGWDPVTGWGSVNFLQFAKMFGITHIVPLGSSPSCPSSSNSNSIIGLSTTIGLTIGLAVAGFIAGAFIYFSCCRSRPKSPPLLPPPSAHGTPGRQGQGQGGGRVTSVYIHNTPATVTLNPVNAQPIK
jgi:tripeptidyl-peptidase I